MSMSRDILMISHLESVLREAWRATCRLLLPLKLALAPVDLQQIARDLDYSLLAMAPPCVPHKLCMCVLMGNPRLKEGHDQGKPLKQILRELQRELEREQDKPATEPLVRRNAMRRCKTIREPRISKKAVRFDADTLSTAFDGSSIIKLAKKTLVRKHMNSKIGTVLRKGPSPELHPYPRRQSALETMISDAFDIEWELHSDA